MPTRRPSSPPYVARPSLASGFFNPGPCPTSRGRGCTEPPPRSFGPPPLLRTIECSCRLVSLPGDVTGHFNAVGEPDASDLPQAELGLRGVMVQTRVQTPRRCGFAVQRGCFVLLSSGFSRPFRTSCWIVAWSYRLHSCRCQNTEPGRNRSFREPLPAAAQRPGGSEPHPVVRKATLGRLAQPNAQKPSKAIDPPYSPMRQPRTEMGGPGWAGGPAHQGRCRGISV
jgi:hypothetical protein